MSKALTRDEEHELFEQLAAGDPDALPILITRNQGLIASIIKRYHTSGAEEEDMMQVGNEGLLTAIRRYDHTRGLKLSTFATWWIRQSVSRFVLRHCRIIRMPEHAMVKLGRIDTAGKEILKETGVEATREELIEATGLNPKTFELLLECGQGLLPMDATLKGSTDATVGGTFVDQRPGPLERAIANDEDSYLRTKLRKLNKRLRKVVLARHGLDDGTVKTYKQIAQIVGVTPERVRQLYRNGINHLRILMVGKDPKASARRKGKAKRKTAKKPGPKKRRGPPCGFGQSLRVARMAVGLSRMELGRRSGFHHVTISHFELGIRSAGPIQREVLRLALVEAA